VETNVHILTSPFNIALVLTFIFIIMSYPYLSCMWHNPEGKYCKWEPTNQKYNGNIDCPKGGYCPGGFLFEIFDPIACPAGTYGVVEGAIKVDECKKCPAGYYQSLTGIRAEDGNEFDPSNPQKAFLEVGGQHIDDHKALAVDVCIKCHKVDKDGKVGVQKGSFCPEGGSSASGSLCPAGYTCAGSSSAPVKARAGYYAPAGSSAEKPCAKGTFSGEAQEKCTVCADGSYAAFEHLSHCHKCAPGQFADVSLPKVSDVCKDCGPGTYQGEAGQVSCKSCEKGTFSSSSKAEACEPAPIGHYVGATKATQATKCPKGTFADKTGVAACTPCAPGEYQPFEGAAHCYGASEDHFVATSGASEDVPCPEGSFTGGKKGLTKCVVCPRDYKWTGTTCAKCDAGEESYGAFVHANGNVIMNCAAKLPETVEARKEREQKEAQDAADAEAAAAALAALAEEMLPA